MGFMTPKQKYMAPPDPLPPPAAPPTTADSSAIQAGNRIRQQASTTAASQGIATSPQGLLTEAKTARKTLLGQ